MLTVCKLLFNRRIADDRSGNKLREERDIGCETNKALLNCCFPAIYVYCVTESLECIKRNTDRKRQTQKRYFRVENAVYIAYKEI